MLVLFTILNRLFALLQKPSLFRKNSPVLHPSVPKTVPPGPSGGDLWCSCRSAVLLPSSFILLTYRFRPTLAKKKNVGEWGVFSLNELRKAIQTASQHTRTASKRAKNHLPTRVMPTFRVTAASPAPSQSPSPPAAPARMQPPTPNRPASAVPSGRYVAGRERR
jgi:hypothetical protein